MSKLLKCPIVLVLLVFANAAPARAVPVHWDVNVTFTDASRMQGSFRYDPVSGAFSDLGLAYSGATLPALVGKTDWSLLDPASEPFVFLALPVGTDLADLTDAPYFEIDVTPDFSDPAATVDFVILSFCRNADCSVMDPGGLFPGSAGVTATPVPLPAGALLLLTALGAAGVARRSRRIA